MAFTGSFVYLQWAPESTFNTAAANIAGSAATQFGFEQKITSWSFTNNKIPLSQLNDVRVKTYAYGQTRGSISLDFVLSSPFFLELVGFRNGDVTGAACDFTHTWDMCAMDSEAKLVQSFTTQIGQCAGGTDIVRTLTGGIVNSATVTTAVGETVKVSLDANYANEAETATLDACLAPLSVCEAIPFTFAHGTLEFPSCPPTIISEVQDVDFTISQNSDHLWGIGSSVAVNSFKRLFEITGKFKASYTDTVQLRKLYAQQNDTLCNSPCGETVDVCAATLKLTFTNDLPTTAERTITFAFTGISIADHNLSIEPNEPIFEEINWQARDCVVTANNSVATAPAAS